MNFIDHYLQLIIVNAHAKLGTWGLLISWVFRCEREKNDEILEYAEFSNFHMCSSLIYLLLVGGGVWSLSPLMGISASCYVNICHTRYCWAIWGGERGWLVDTHGKDVETEISCLAPKLVRLAHNPGFFRSDFSILLWLSEPRCTSTRTWKETVWGQTWHPMTPHCRISPQPLTPSPAKLPTAM